MTQQRKARHFGSRGPINLLDVIQPRESIPEPTVRLGIDRIDPSPRNPRRTFEGIDELAESIRAYGLLQPVVVREQDARYELIAGHRRFAALQLLAEREPKVARWRVVDAVVRDEGEEEAYLLTLTENLQREDLRPREEAAALEVLVRERGWSVRKVADAIKMSPAYVSKRLRVFDDPVLAPLVLTERLSVSMAEELLALDAEDRGDVAARAAEDGWDRTRIRAEREKCLAAKRSASAAPRPDLERRLRALAEELLPLPTELLAPSQHAEAVNLLNVLRRLVGQKK